MRVILLTTPGFPVSSSSYKQWQGPNHAYVCQSLSIVALGLSQSCFEKIHIVLDRNVFHAHAWRDCLWGFTELFPAPARSFFGNILTLNDWSLRARYLTPRLLVRGRLRVQNGVWSLLRSHYSGTRTCRFLPWSVECERSFWKYASTSWDLPFVFMPRISFHNLSLEVNVSDCRPIPLSSKVLCIIAFPRAFKALHQSLHVLARVLVA